MYKPNTPPPYTRAEFVSAVNYSAGFGWGGIFLAALLSGAFGVLPLVVIFGLPVAYLTCWTTTSPFIYLAMRRSISRTAAPIYGGAIMGVICVVLWLYGRHVGWSHDTADTGHGYFLSPLRIMWYAAEKGTLFILIYGAGIASIVRAVIGPGRA